MSVDRFGFEESDWEVLKAGPMQMLKQVAGADSHIDRIEWTALVDAVWEAVGHEDPLVAAVMEDLSGELHDTGAFGQQNGFDPLEGLRAIAQLLDSRPDGGSGFRETLLKFGATIADSSGAPLIRTFAAHHNSPGWVRAAGTSAMEREALKAASEALGVG